MANILDNPLDVAAQRLGQLRREVSSEDVDLLSASRTKRDYLNRLKASTYIWTAACLESYTHEFLTALFRAVEGAAVPVSQLRLSMMPLVLDGKFSSLKQLSGLKMWQSRIAVMLAAHDTSLVTFGTAMPTDGGTIRERHLELFWSVFGFKGHHVPSAMHGMALKEVADWRNKLAHGEIDPIEFGRKKTSAEVNRMVSRIEDIVLHLDEAGRDFIATGKYRR